MISDKISTLPTTSSQPIQQSSTDTTTSPPTLNSTNTVVSKFPPPSHPVFPITVPSTVPITSTTTRVAKTLSVPTFRQFVEDYQKSIAAIEKNSLYLVLPRWNQLQKDAFAERVRHLIGGSTPISGHCDVMSKFLYYLLNPKTCNQKLPLTQVFSGYIKDDQEKLSLDLKMRQAVEGDKKVQEEEHKYLQSLVEKMPKDTIVTLHSINELFEHHRLDLNSRFNQFVHNISEIQNSFPTAIEPPLKPIVTEPDEETGSSNISASSSNIIREINDNDEGSLSAVTEPTSDAIPKHRAIEMTEGPLKKISQLLGATSFKTIEQWESYFTDMANKIADRDEAKALINNLLLKINSAQIPQSIKSDMQSQLQWLNTRCEEEGPQCLNLQAIKFSLFHILNNALKGAVKQEVDTIGYNIYNLINPPKCGRMDIISAVFGKAFPSEIVDEFFSKIQDHKPKLIAMGASLRALKAQTTYQDAYNVNLKLYLLLTEIMEKASATKANDTE